MSFPSPRCELRVFPPEQIRNERERGGIGTGPVIMAPPGGSWRAVAIAMVAAAALVTPLATRMAEKWLAVGSPPASPGPEKDTVAVVLGYALERDGTPSPELRDRVKQGVSLFVRGDARRVVFSGGHPGGGLRGNKSEAEVMAEYATGLLGSKEKERWLLEHESTSTRTNAIFTIQKLWDLPPPPRPLVVYIVTSPFHQRRSLLVFRQAHRELSSGAAFEMSFEAAWWKDQEEAAHSPLLVLRELAAMAYYGAIRGWLGPLQRVI